MNPQTQTGKKQSIKAARLEAAVSRRGLIGAEVAKLAVAAYPESLLSIILTGSLARDEATWAGEGSRSVALGDAEFMLVFREGTRLPRCTDLEALQERVESALNQRGVTCSVSLNAVSPDYFRKLPPHIFTYELRTCGRVVWGDHNVVSLVPAFAVSDILREDAWRLLANRMIEQLACHAADPQAEPIGETPGLGKDRRGRTPYRLAKLYLDMATSFLVFAGAYEPTYRGRAQRLRELAGRCTGDVLTVASSSATGSLPFPLRDFADRVSDFTRFKIGEAGCPIDDEIPAPTRSLVESAWDYARLLWRWELNLLVTSKTDPPDPSLESALPHDDSALIESLMRCQTIRERLRGWLYVVRASGWLCAWRFWPRWVRLGRRGSPRYCVYRAASELAVALPGILKAQSAGPIPGTTGAAPTSEAHDLDADGVCSWLPLVPESTGTGIDQARLLAQAVLWNYDRFLKGTRA